ncbi:aminoglycoside phosphotransferase [Streptomyces celluloflavus]
MEQHLPASGRATEPESAPGGPAGAGASPAPDVPGADSAPPPASRRRDWDDLPADVRAAVREHTGPIRSARSAGAGFSSQLAVTLDTARGRVFVKGMRQDHAEAWTQRREADVGPHIVPLGPRLLWHVTAGGWDLLGFEHLTGRSADYGPASADLPLVVEAMTALGRIACPEVELADAGQRWAAYLDDPADARLFTGTALLHTDWHHTNVLITGPDAAPPGNTPRPTDTARLIDWPWATRGAAWIDPACWIVWLGFAGHDPQQAERWAAKVPAWSTAPAGALDLFATAQARFWQETEATYPNAWTHGLRDAADRWAAHRADG